MAAIEVKNVAKKFRVYYDGSASLKEKLLFKNRSRYEERQVLNDISFKVEKGEAVGLIGQNGCGKSTMLKLMTKIMYPDKGTIEMTGRVSSLIELGAGFHPDMSGRENIYTNASIFGLTRKEIDSRVKQIIEFSELDAYINNPVRTYSSGMYMRLAFSVAINVDADIILVDEILAVGDANFQAKCFNKMREIKAKGVTIVIVSHSLGQIEQLCEKSYWIENRVIYKQGSPFDVHAEYMDYMGQKTRNAEQHNPEITETLENKEVLEQETLNLPQTDTRWGNRDVEIISAALLDESEQEKNVYKTGDFTNIRIKYKVNKSVKNPVVGIGVFRNDGVNCYGTNTFIDRLKINELEKDGVIDCKVFNNNLLPGEYSLDVAIHAEDGFAYDYYRSILQFKMYSSINDVGIARIGHQWNIM